MIAASNGRLTRAFCEREAYSDAELRRLEKAMLAPGAYATDNPRVVIIKLLATIRKHHPKKRTF